MCRVRGVERSDHPRPEVRQQLVVLPLRIDLRRRCLLPSRPEKRRRSTRSHEHRKGLVERRLTGCVEGVVSQLVDHRVRETERITFESGVEQWIVEESERAEGIGRTDVHVEPIRREIFRISLRRAEVEIAFVRNSSNDRKPPRVWLESITVSSGYHKY